MGVSYSTALKNFRMSAVGVFIDSGTGAGRLEMSTAGLGTLLVTITLQRPSVSGSATAGAITFAGFPKTGTAVAAGTLGGAQVKDSSGTVVIDALSISTANAEIIVDNTSVAINQLVVISSIVITHG
jgi:hypothetical protein